MAQAELSRFHEDANMIYQFPVERDAEGKETEDRSSLLLENPQAIQDMVEHHQAFQQPRLYELKQYYLGNNLTILEGQRRKERHLSDHRASHNFAKYVSNFIQGYMVGDPIKTTYTESESIAEEITDINRHNDADEHNSDLVLDQSVYGRAYEILYRGQDDITRFNTLDVHNTFVIYDDSVAVTPIAGVRYLTPQFSEGDEVTVMVYTDREIITYTLDKDGMSEESRQEHSFGGVPIIEYENNKMRQGDFEDVLSLIDLYDSSESDTANYMTDLNDAMLVIQGNLRIDTDSAQNMKEKNTMLLETIPDEHGRSVPASANYIYKQYDVSGTEAYKSRIEADIHKFTNTPNMNDVNFGGVQSGEAMKYKLFGLEQVRATKERMFKKGLRQRYRLINNLGELASELEFEVNELSFTFSPNLPKSLSDEIDSFVKLGGQLSEETKLSLLSIIENPQEELKKLQEENPQDKASSEFEDAFRQVQEEAQQETPEEEE